MKPDREKLYQFIRRWYKHSRFEGVTFVEGYPEIIIDGYMKHFETNDVAFISCHESNTGQAIKFDAELNILNPDAPVVEYRRSKGHLTHLLG